MNEETRQLNEDGEHIMSNRCRYHLARASGCRNGDQCQYCHEHAWLPGEKDSMQKLERPQQDKCRKLGKSERAAQKLVRDQHPWLELRLRRKEAAQHAARTDMHHNLTFGAQVEGVHMAFWTVHRLLEQTLKARERLARIFDVNPDTFGIWYGVDKLSENPGHYLADSRPHGVHTLMKGLARRLEALVAEIKTEGIILMEGGLHPRPEVPPSAAAASAAAAA